MGKGCAASAVQHEAGLSVGMRSDANAAVEPSVEMALIAKTCCNGCISNGTAGSKKFFCLSHAALSNVLVGRQACFLLEFVDEVESA